MQIVQLTYDVRWSDQLSESFVSDFLSVHSQVFGPLLSRAEFQRKYQDNIFGRSVLAVVYDLDKPVAARALWRNDLEQKQAYQPVDTCVLPSYQGRGIFREMTQKALEFLPTDTAIYNFPNHQSRPAYLKIGWCLQKCYHLRLMLSLRSYLKEHLVQPTPDYLDWWMKGRKTLRCVSCCGKWLIVAKLNKPFCYKVLAVAEEKLFPVAFPALCFYDSVRKSFYNKDHQALYVVGRNLDQYIPTWKLDAVE